ncbi:MAG TPA: polyprenyl synthetase family protein [Bacteroidetes bacterium]|nr:polyprenyl synthetase family protein [Bacteroidota bacterium]
MYTFNELSERVNKIIRELDIPETPVELYEPIRYILNLGGKRIRPVLTLMTTNLFRDNIEDALAPAISIELFHNFTLIHDDIMDHAVLRRNHSTVHTQWNVNIGILSGDALSIYAYRYLLKAPHDRLYQLLKIFNDTALKVCEGQQLDMNYENIPEITIDDYLTMIELKTAVLLAGAMKIGGIIAGATEEQTNHLYECGRYLGLAFQIQDDFLDTYGDTETFGKTIGGDILSNKKTFLPVYTLGHLPEARKKEMLEILNAPITNDREYISTIKNFYDSVNIPEITKNIITDYFRKGMNELAKTEVSIERRKLLEELITNLISRTK